MSDAEEAFQARFGGVGRLVSAAGLARLRRAHACVIGLGGVGSWVVEALARSGIGKLTLVDLDEVCVSNVNRQLPALDGETGKSKVVVMAERARAIRPGIEVIEKTSFYTEATSGGLLEGDIDVVVDAIDSGRLKAHLIAACRDRGLPTVISGGAGGRRDATRIQVGDLGRASGDALLAKVRKELRAHYGYPKYKGKKFGVPCVFTDEPIRYPWPDGSVRSRPEPGSDAGLNCESGIGTGAWVTGAMGLVMAQVAIELIIDPETR